MAIKSMNNSAAHLLLPAKLNGVPISIGFRRNNPGNAALRSKTKYPGETTRPDTGRGPLFKAFKTMPYGLAAMYKNLYNNYINAGYSTISKMSSKYAPASQGNNTAKWAADISKRSGIGINTSLIGADKDMMFRLVQAIIKTESGGGNLYIKVKGKIVAQVTADDMEEGWAIFTEPMVA